MKRFYFIFLTILTSISCNNNEVTCPEFDSKLKGTIVENFVAKDNIKYTINYVKSDSSRKCMESYSNHCDCINQMEISIDIGRNKLLFVFYENNSKLSSCFINEFYDKNKSLTSELLINSSSFDSIQIIKLKKSGDSLFFNTKTLQIIDIR